jgi:thioredoxin-dependent peroxiredoxin
MANITLKGNPINTCGTLPEIGSDAPDFTLTAQDLKDMTLKDFEGQKLILNITPSIDTAVCQVAARKFNESASSLEGTKVLVISNDLPFAYKRFCAAEGLEDVVTLSQMRSSDFGKKYGVEMTDGPMASLTARAVVVLDQNHKVTYTQLVPEIAQEPNYDEALNAAKGA